MTTMAQFNRNRRFFLKNLGLGAAAMAASGMAARSGEAAGRNGKPNFVFILIDDMGWPDPACYGHSFHETPHIDKLAGQGMKFTDAYAACPVCSPTRASIMSGQYPARLGLTDFIPGHWRPYEKLRVPINRQQNLPLEALTIAEALKPAGYTTGVFGKWHLGGQTHFPDKQGFDDWMVTSGAHFNFRTFPKMDIQKDDYMADVLTTKCEQFIEANQNNPFCVFLTHYAVHIPLQARQALIKKYEEKSKPAAGVNNPVYAAMVEHVDSSVGRVLQKLSDCNLDRNTVVVFFSDNGGLRQIYTGDGPIVSTNDPLRNEKGTLYEGGIRVPLIVRWPGNIEAGAVCREPVSSVDFYPTFLDIAQIKKQAGAILDGESLTPLLRQDGSLKRDAIFWHYPHYHHSAPAGAIRLGDYKLIEFYDDSHIELYNLRDDIGETRNLAQSMPDRAIALRDRLAEWRKSVNAQMPAMNPDYDPSRAHEWGKHPDR
ncbi:MAG: sulfatase [Candidatus Omnitrophica bacterium]|nr:sulfatase [Candidatus Omnitrophota bacterium]